jgi:hypothetical protein
MKHAQYIRPEEAETGFQIGDDVVAVEGMSSKGYPVPRGTRLTVVDIGVGEPMGEYVVVEPVDAPFVKVYAHPWEVRRAWGKPRCTPEEAVMRYDTGCTIRMMDDMVGETQEGPIKLLKGQRFIVQEVFPNLGRLKLFRADGLGGGPEIMLRVSRRIAMDQEYVKDVQEYLKGMGYGNTAASKVERAIGLAGGKPGEVDAFDMASEIQRMIQQGEELDLYGADVTAGVCPACKRLKARCKGRTACYDAAGVRTAQSETDIDVLLSDGMSVGEIATYLEMPVEEVQAIIDRMGEE